MRKLKRPKIIKEVLENRIEKNQRRIQKIAEENFLLRQQLNALMMFQQKPNNKPTEVEKVANAEHEAVMDSADQEIGTSL